ncbi:DNA primase [Myroides marinus]|uniref:DNA primase n=1 Tax=Myroides TaxID=76831 RepID=UPI00257913A5|nr:DNA primase [Myroides marinus]MDM1367587.1 DNA primase [Myroides marinus]MDM1371746.1 DNA primase [Myroides marinus]MDM1374726.1 DNA primase [Myroides marinus]MDM1379558.1 DNA primase [Myroides marinus]MDM1382231.1 DNA primase [Myroides marinus]
MISKSTIDAVFDAARVEEVIGDFVTLKKSGSNYKGLSPFVNEKTPSFMVSPVKQIWKDFSSGKGGNAISFIMEHEHFSYPEAIRYLAKKYGIEIEETEQSDEEKEQLNEKESMFIVSEFAKKYFEETLFHAEEGKAIGMTYFKERGFTQETIKEFGLGYSPDQWSAFTDAALQKGYSLEYLEKTGLTIVKEDRKFDRFKGRVMFPIQSMSGRVLGFGGRILITDKKAAKYLNSPESDIYHKSKVLYGIFHAKQEIAKQDNCFLVEGYTDVIQMHQTGIKNVVASSGTALTPDQIRLISRLTKNITMLFDGDAAGIRASMRGVDLILEAGMNVRVCPLPDGEDPDSFARKHSKEQLDEYFKNNATDFIRFKANLLMGEAKSDPIKKAELIRDMVQSISKIPDQIQKEIYVQECARIMDISEDVIFNSLAQIGRKELADANKKYVQERKQMEVVHSEQQPKEAIDPQYNLERKIIEILLLYGNMEEQFIELLLDVNEDNEVIEVEHKVEQKVYERIYLSLQEDEVQLTNPMFKVIYKDIMDYFNHNVWDLEKYLKTLNPEMAQEVTSIIMEDEKETLHNWESQNIIVKQKVQGVSQYVTETILTLRMYLLNTMIEKYKVKLKDSDEKRSYEMLTLIMDYTSLMNMFSKRLGQVTSRFKTIEE